MNGSYLSFLVKAKVYSVKFQQTITKILSLDLFPIIFFPKSIFKVPGKKLGLFFMNKKVCIQLMVK